MTILSTATARPAETATGVIGVVAGLAIALTNADPKIAGLITAGVSLLAAAVTWLHSNGGLAGAWASLVHGSTPPV